MKNKSLKALFLFNGIFFFAANLLGPLYAIFVRTIDTNILSVSLSWSVFLVSTTIFTFFVGKYGASIREKEYLLLGGYLIRAVAWFLFPAVSSIATLVMLQALLGIGEALGTPSFDAIFARHLDKDKAIKDYADWKLIANIVSAIAVIIGGFWINAFGFPSLFYLMGSLAVVSFIGIWVKPRRML